MSAALEHERDRVSAWKWPSKTWINLRKIEIWAEKVNDRQKNGNKANRPFYSHISATVNVLHKINVLRSISITLISKKENLNVIGVRGGNYILKPNVAAEWFEMLSVFGRPQVQFLGKEIGFPDRRFSLLSWAPLVISQVHHLTT